MQIPTAADEFLHRPGDRRLWNESYYFHFNSMPLDGYLRLGFQPYEDRANLWLYLLDGKQTYWYRNENIDLSKCAGLHVDNENLSVACRIETPNKKWSIDVDGECGFADDIAAVFADQPQGNIPIELDLIFTANEHAAYQEDRGYDAHSIDKEHYTQPGYVSGDVTIGEDNWSINTMGFRDHSWGGLRDWTPARGGYYWFALQFETGDVFKIAASVSPDGSITDSFHGYHADIENIRIPKGLTVEYSDDGGPENRLDRWLRGDMAEEINIEFTFENKTEQFTLIPTGYTPLGYEDRNWQATELDTPWVTAVINRLPVICKWDGHEGTGWYETMHPRTRVDI